MRRALLLAAVLALAPAAAEEPTTAAPKSPSTKAPKSSTKATGKASASKASPSAKGGARKAAPAADPAQLAEVFRAKTNLLFAVEACERPERCDKAFRAESEERFMKACLECAPEERCEADRQAIRNGEGKRSYNPCSAP